MAVMNEDGLTLPEEEMPGIVLALAMMDANAPSHLTLDELASVIQACSFMVADSLVQGFRQYLLPIADELPPHQVWHHFDLLRCSGHGSSTAVDDSISPMPCCVL